MSSVLKHSLIIYLKHSLNYLETRINFLVPLESVVSPKEPLRCNLVTKFSPLLYSDKMANLSLLSISLCFLVRHITLFHLAKQKHFQNYALEKSIMAKVIKLTGSSF